LEAVMNELIMIVEDAKDTVELLRYNLQKEGYRTVTATDGEEAIAAIQAHKPDLVLLDIMLPGLNGWEVCQQLRSMDRSMPVIMLTALSTKDDQIKGLALGADDYIPKPFSVKELMLRVKRLMEKEHILKTVKAREKEETDRINYLVHELKNTVQVIGGFSGLAMEKGNNDRYLSCIKSSALHMEGILNDTSLLSKLEKGKGLSPMGTVDIGEQLSWSVNAVREDAGNKEIDIHLLSDTPCMVQGNAMGVRQVLLNLLSNAIKYNRRQGKIWAFTKETVDQIEVSIKDTGYGIAEDELPMIFDKFYRARGSEMAKGTGLGLYLVKQLMEAMGGKVSAKSRETVGSTFTVSFIRSVPSPLAGEGQGEGYPQKERRR
jgi:signal transduction histidine kinase